MWTILVYCMHYTAQRPLVWQRLTPETPAAFFPCSLAVPQTPEKTERYKLAELKNGRLAMMGVSGALTQMAMTGHGFPFMG